jgi:2,3-dihydroxybenzoate-AMP ligase
MWDAARAYGSAEALVDGELRLSYRQLMALSDLLATRLRDLGLRPGDPVLVQLPNCWEFVALTIACFRLGLLPVMALPAHRELELGQLAKHSEAVAIAVPSSHRGYDHGAMAERLQDGSAGLGKVLVLGEPRPGQLALGELVGQDRSQLEAEAVAERARLLDTSSPDPSDVALFLLSGGTTGVPKLIPRTHDDYAYNARAAARVSGLDEHTVYLAVLPVGHNFPLACPGILGTLLFGGRVVIGPSPDPEQAFALIEREGVTHTAVVPAVAQRWLDEAPKHRFAASSLRVLQVGGARLAPEVARRVRPTLGATLQQVFGMAEGLLNYTRLDDPEDAVCETQGRPVSPDDEVRIVDEEGRDVPDGEMGMLITQGPYTLRGYYRLPEVNATSFTADGWYRSGDVVRRHPSGNFVVEGRVKDLINRGGEKISAEEIENLAYLHPAVARASAVAMPDAALGERVCIFVVAKPGHSLTLEELRTTMEGAGAARYKLPERLELLEEMPLTAVGKVDKRALQSAASRFGQLGEAGGQKTGGKG